MTLYESVLLGLDEHWLTDIAFVVPDHQVSFNLRRKTANRKTVTKETDTVHSAIRQRFNDSHGWVPKLGMQGTRSQCGH
jgi:hypothetical protein